MLRKIAVIFGIMLNVIGLVYLVSCGAPKISPRELTLVVPNVELISCRPASVGSMNRNAEHYECLEDVAGVSADVVGSDYPLKEDGGVPMFVCNPVHESIMDRCE